MSRILTASIAVALLVMSTATSINAQCKNSQKQWSVSTSAPRHEDKKDIVDTAVGAKSFNTLVAAVKAADLVAALKSDGPFTVFAPTDEAFAKLPKGTVEALLLPKNKEKLIAVLKYHVVSGKVMAGDVLRAMEVKTLQGSKAKISLSIDGAKIIKTDIECSNGVIHVIDSVILPK